MVPLRAAVESSGVDLAALSQYGILGIFAVLMVVFIRTQYKRETDRADALVQENKDLHSEIREQHEYMREKVIPALVSVASIMEDSSNLLVEMHAIVRALRELPPTPRRRRIEGDQ